MLTLESTKKELIAAAQEKGITANLERLNKTQILEMINEAPTNAAAPAKIEVKVSQKPRIPRCEMF